MTFQVVHKFEHSIASIEFSFAASILDSAFVKYVIKGNDRVHLVQFDFLNAKHNIIFDGDVHRSILLIGNIKQSGIISNKLIIFDFSDSVKRRFAIKFDMVVSLPLTV